MTKEELALEVIRRLKEEYPDAGCTLDYNEAWKLLVSVRLAAQCTDARVNVVVQDLYARYPTVDALAVADVEEIEAIVRPCGLGRSKARDISGCMKILKEQYGGKVPEDFDALLKLPGVGRKSANLIMGDVFGKPAIVTDTHCIRLCNRIGLVDGNGLLPAGVTAFRLEKGTAAPDQGVYFFCHCPRLFGDNKAQFSGADAGQDFVHDPGQQETHQNTADQTVQASGHQQGSGGHHQQVHQKGDFSQGKMRAQLFYGKHNKIRSAGGGASGVNQAVAQAGENSGAEGSQDFISPIQGKQRGDAVHQEGRKKQGPQGAKKKSAAQKAEAENRDGQIQKQGYDSHGSAADSHHGKSGGNREIDNAQGGQHGAGGFQGKIGKIFFAVFRMTHETAPSQRPF